jgi:hypothetical protein
LTLSDRNAITISASGGNLRSGSTSTIAGTSSSTEDEQLTIALDHSFSERFTLYIMGGVNDRSAQGRKIGYVGQFTLKRVDERNQWKLDVARTVSASGFGVLTQHTAGSLSFSRDLGFKLNAELSLNTAQDSQDLISGPLLQQSRRYEGADATLGWLSGETSTVSLVGGYSRASTDSAPPTPLAHGWRFGVSYRWTPRPSSFSR